MKDLLLGIDIGTTGTKCTFYDFEGNQAVSAYREYPMIRPKPGWCEQDPEQWWGAVCGCLRKCLESGEVSASRVAAIGLSGTNAIVLTDKMGDPVCNALCLHDRRASAQLERLQKELGTQRVLETTGNRLAMGSFALPRLKWMQEELPEAISRSYKFLTAGGFVTQRLTGKFIISHSRANLTLMADINTGDWAYDIVDDAGFPRGLLPESIASCTVAGTVTEEAARATGLLSGTPVCSENVDTVAATLAAGAVDAGDFAITIGSSGRICFISSGPTRDERLLSCESPVSGTWTTIQTTNSAGVSLRWFRDVFGQGAAETARKKNVSIYRVLDEEAAAAPPGADGLIYLPYLSGEQSPIWNPAAQGVFFGMTLGSEYGHFVRAVLEGVAFSIKDCLSIVSNADSLPDMIPIGGGAANSPLWCQIFADVLGCPVSKTVQAETETLGDIITAAKSIGLERPSIRLGKQLLEKNQVFYPRGEYREMYDNSFHKFKRLYTDLAGEF